MFLEPQPLGFGTTGPGTGWVEVVCGSMFSGKTEELLRRLRRAQIAHQRVELFKPAFDKRYHETDVVSHNRQRLAARAVEHSQDIYAAAAGCEVIGIDEAQFFDAELPEVCRELANMGKRIIIAGLDMDSNGEPFGPMPILMATAEFVTKVNAICMSCGATAAYSYRLINNTDKLMLGETDLYEARCRKCFIAGTKAKGKN
jgi:thymidine kinase